MTDPLTNATDRQLAEAIEDNGVDGCLNWARWPGMERHDDEHLKWTMTDVPFPFFNNAFLPNMGEQEVESTVGGVLDIACERNVPMFFWTGPTTRPVDYGKRLINMGFQHGFEASAMAIDLSTYDGLSSPSGESCGGPPDPVLDCVVREVADETLLAQWCQVMAPTYEFPEFAAETWMEILLHIGLGPSSSFRHFVGCVDDAPVASASLYLGYGVGGISSVATLPEYRRRGIGTAITRAVLEEIQQLGYQYSTLFASSMGRSIYERLGFREYAKGNCYVWMNQENGSGEP